MGEHPLRYGLRPGSPEAQREGCTCPVMDNHYGRGYWGNAEKYGYVHNAECPVHGFPESPEAPVDPEPKKNEE